MSIRVGITGQSGFVGSYLFNTLGLQPEKYERVEFNSTFFEMEGELDEFVKKCDVIVHLAAINRHENQEYLYDININLAKKIIASLQRTSSTPHVLFSSSSHEERDSLYGKSKREVREMFAEWAKENKAKFTGMVIPNVFGPFGKPFHNSFVTTFCYQLTHGEEPTILHDGEVEFIYVGELVNDIVTSIDNQEHNECKVVPSTAKHKVSEVLEKLKNYKSLYLEKGEIPLLESRFELNLFNTYRSYIEPENLFPVKFVKNVDNRGAFVEIIRLGIGGQCSFSTTVAGITRGNHFHTRKIERFAVIKGKALIQLRKIGEDKVHNFEIDGETPGYVDMPIWYTHNITNIGEGELYTVFWINEPYNPEDADTYFVPV